MPRQSLSYTREFRSVEIRHRAIVLAVREPNLAFERRNAIRFDLIVAVVK